MLVEKDQVEDKKAGQSVLLSDSAMIDMQQDEADILQQAISAVLTDAMTSTSLPQGFVDALADELTRSGVADAIIADLKTLVGTQNGDKAAVEKRIKDVIMFHQNNLLQQMQEVTDGSFDDDAVMEAPEEHVSEEIITEDIVMEEITEEIIVAYEIEEDFEYVEVIETVEEVEYEEDFEMVSDIVSVEADVAQIPVEAAVVQPLVTPVVMNETGTLAKPVIGITAEPELVTVSTTETPVEAELEEDFIINEDDVTIAVTDQDAPISLNADVMVAGQPPQNSTPVLDTQIAEIYVSVPVTDVQISALNRVEQQAEQIVAKTVAPVVEAVQDVASVQPENIPPVTAKITVAEEIILPQVQAETIVVAQNEIVDEPIEVVALLPQIDIPVVVEQIEPEPSLLQVQMPLQVFVQDDMQEQMVVPLALSVAVPTEALHDKPVPEPSGKIVVMTPVCPVAQNEQSAAQMQNNIKDVLAVPDVFLPQAVAHELEVPKTTDWFKDALDVQINSFYGSFVSYDDADAAEVEDKPQHVIGYLPMKPNAA